MAEATDIKIDVHVPMDSSDMRPWKFSNWGHGQGHVTPTFLFHY